MCKAAKLCLKKGVTVTRCCNGIHSSVLPVCSCCRSFNLKRREEAEMIQQQKEKSFRQKLRDELELEWLAGTAGRSKPCQLNTDFPDKKIRIDLQIRIRIDTQMVILLPENMIQAY